MRLGLVVCSEIVKADSLRASVRIATMTAGAVIGVSWLLTALVRRSIDSGRTDDVAGLEPASAFLVVLHYGQVGVLLLGCWMVYEEQERASLRTSLIAVPTRHVLFLSKAVVAGAASFLVAAVSVIGSYWVRSLVVGAAALTDGGAQDARVLSGYIAYWTMAGVLAFALSVLMRSGLVGLGVMLATVLAVSTYLLSLTPVSRFLPDQAGAQMYQEVPPSVDDLGPRLGLLVMSLWVVAALFAGGASFRAWAAR